MSISQAAARSVASWCIGSLGTGPGGSSQAAPFQITPLAGARVPVISPQGQNMGLECLGLYRPGRSKTATRTVGQTAKDDFHEP